MHLWNIDKLKEDIKQGALNEKERFKYVLLYLVILTIGQEYNSYIEESDLVKVQTWHYIESILTTLIVLTGSIFAFKANNGTQGTDFLGRYFSLSFVLGIRFIVIVSFVALVTILIEVLLTIFFNIYIFIELWLEGGPYIALCYVIYYWRLYFHIKQVNV